MAIGKKGNAISDSLIAVLGVFIFVLVAIFSYQLLNDFNTEWQASDAATISKTETQTLTTAMPITFDYGAVMLLVLLWVAAIISSFLIEAHPAFAVLSFVLLLLLTMVPMFMANIYADIVDDPAVTGDDQFTLSDFFMRYLAHYYFALGLSVVVVLYGKARGL